MVTRRELLGRCGMGLGLLAFHNLFSLLAKGGDGPAAPAPGPLAPRRPHFPPRAKRVIHIFANGGPSHVDTFDPKPLLERFRGRTLPVPSPITERKTGGSFPSPFKFQKYGRVGLEVSELFPRVGAHADDMCVIRSMKADFPNHEPSLLLMNCGENRQVRPSMGSWITYALGSENQNLPAFVVMCPGGYPFMEAQNWQSAFLPPLYQGTYMDGEKRRMDELLEDIENKSASPEEQKQQLELLRKLNARHQEPRKDDARLEARIQTFELAARMQLEAPDAFDVSKEPAEVQELYGPGVQARQLLMARRLVERGVRFVQVYSGPERAWDHHDNLEIGHRKLAEDSDHAIAGLLADLKQRGMLDDTLVIWGGEFGRTPTVELATPGFNLGKLNGRDHNCNGFTMWLAGGGTKRGYIHGATDETGFEAVEKPVHVHDLHATILHLLGLDHLKLTFRHAGRDMRLTDVYGTVVHDLIV